MLPSIDPLYEEFLALLPHIASPAPHEKYRGVLDFLAKNNEIVKKDTRIRKLVHEHRLVEKSLVVCDLASLNIFSTWELDIPALSLQVKLEVPLMRGDDYTAAKNFINALNEEDLLSRDEKTTMISRHALRLFKKGRIQQSQILTKAAVSFCDNQHPPSLVNEMFANYVLSDLDIESDEISEFIGYLLTNGASLAYKPRRAKNGDLIHSILEQLIRGNKENVLEIILKKAEKLPPEPLWEAAVIASRGPDLVTLEKIIDAIRTEPASLKYKVLLGPKGILHKQVGPWRGFNSAVLAFILQKNKKEGTLGLVKDACAALDRDGCTLLHYAAAADQNVVDLGSPYNNVQLLIDVIRESSTDPSSAVTDFVNAREQHLSQKPHNQGNTPLHVAANAGNLAAIKTLVEAGADLYLTNAHGETVAQAAAMSASPNAGNVLKYIFEKAPSLISEKSDVSDNTTADTKKKRKNIIHYAVLPEYPSNSALLFMIDKIQDNTLSSDVLAQVDEHGFTPIALAMRYRANTEQEKALITLISLNPQAANIRVPQSNSTTPPSLGNTTLYRALKNRQSEKIVLALIAATDFSVLTEDIDFYGPACLFLAMGYNSTAIFQALIKKGLSPNVQFQGIDKTHPETNPYPLILAAVLGHHDEPAYMDAFTVFNAGRSEAGENLLHQAITNNKPRVLMRILEKASPDDVCQMLSQRRRLSGPRERTLTPLEEVERLAKIIGPNKELWMATLTKMDNIKKSHRKSYKDEPAPRVMAFSADEESITSEPWYSIFWTTLREWIASALISVLNYFSKAAGENASASGSQSNNESAFPPLHALDSRSGEKNTADSGTSTLSSAHASTTASAANTSVSQGTQSNTNKPK